MQQLEKRGRKKSLTAIEEELVFQMHQKGLPVAEIAYKSGVSASTVQRIVKRLKSEKE